MAAKHIKDEKKGMGCFAKGLLILVGLIAVGALAIFVWFKLNRGKMVESMLTDASNIEDHVGKEMPAFDVERSDGSRITFADVSEGKEVTAVVLYASWCGPCEKEFPEMDAVYQEYQDKMGMIAIDVDMLDTLEDVKKYEDSHNLTFPLAYGTDNESLDFVKTSNYPTTLLVDRDGIIRFWRVGSIPNAEDFEMLVTLFMGDDYAGAEPAYYTFMAYAKENTVPGVEFSVITEDGEQTYVTGEGGTCPVFFEKRADMQIKVLSVPEGYEITNNGEATTGLISSIVRLPVG